VNTKAPACRSHGAAPTHSEIRRESAYPGLTRLALASMLLAACGAVQPGHALSTPVAAVGGGSGVRHCTILTVSRGDRVFFAGNNDYTSRDITYWVDPGNGAHYGAIYFGEPDDVQQGFNQKGLAYDANGLPEAPVASHPGREPVEGGYTSYPVHILRECATVKEVIGWVQKHRWHTAMRDQLHFADATGDAVVISAGPDGKVAFTRKPAGDSFLVSSNFNLANPSNGGYPCWRYSRAQEMLSHVTSREDLTAERVASIMEAVHLEGRDAWTVHSVVADLRQRVVYVYFMFQYDAPIVLNVDAEIARAPAPGPLSARFPPEIAHRADQAYQRLVAPVALPNPTGPYAVGTRYLHFRDDSRPKPFTEAADDVRQLAVQAWYPTDEKGGTPAPYLPPTELLPAWVRDVKTHALLNAPLARRGAPYPVVVFSHGWGEYAAQNTVLMEELASHGYAVFAVSHPYESKFWLGPSGNLMQVDMQSAELQARLKEQSNPEVLSLFSKMKAASTDEEREAVLRRTVELLPKMLTESSRLWSQDISFVIGEVVRMAAGEGAFAGRLDASRIGVVGMSLGGIAAGDVCLRDARCRAGVNLDGGPYAQLDDTIGRPFLFMSSERYRGYDRVFLSHTAGPSYAVVVRGSDHYNYTDLCLLDPPHAMVGDIQPARMLAIVNAYVLAFLDRYLKGQQSPLLRGPSPDYPEVAITAKAAGGTPD
jgi:predicted dienelactone hydrolase